MDDWKKRKASANLKNLLKSIKERNDKLIEAIKKAAAGRQTNEGHTKNNLPNSKEERTNVISFKKGSNKKKD